MAHCDHLKLLRTFHRWNVRMKESRNRPAAMTDYEMLLLPMGAAILQIMYQHTVNAIVYIITVICPQRRW